MAFFKDRIKVIDFNRKNFDFVGRYIDFKEQSFDDCHNDPLFMQLPLTSAKRKMSEILKLPTGKTGNADKKYEDYVVQLLASLLYPHLDFAQGQCRTDSGVQIRDLIFYNNQSIPFFKDMTWMGKAQQIRRQNMKVNTVASKLFAMLREDGVRCCILKGQGNALMYPNPYSRTSGDIDVWIDASRERIMEYTQKKFELEDDIRLQHLETSLDGVPVELHFFPCSMNNPIYHARLQKWFKRNADLQCSHIVGLPDGAGDIAIPTTAFNVVYQLTHLYHHFFDGGIGMRQIIDYFLVVNDFSKNVFLNNKSSKITPSLFTLKEGSTSHPDPLTLRGEGGNRPTRCCDLDF